MSNFLIFLHSWVRWIILIAVLVSIIRAIAGLSGHKKYVKKDRLWNLIFMISMDVQFLIGVILYFIGGWYKNWGGNIGAMMKNDLLRFFTMEHSLMMIIALIITHLGNSLLKKTSVDRKKHRTALIFFGIAFILIIAAIPWPFRVNLGLHPWFRF